MYCNFVLNLLDMEIWPTWVTEELASLNPQIQILGRENAKTQSSKRISAYSIFQGEHGSTMHALARAK